MKSLRLTLEHTDDTIHPVHQFVCESPAVDRELLLHGNTTSDVDAYLFYVEGDREAYEAVLDGVPEVLEYDVTPGGDGFYVYVREDGREQDELLVEAFQRDTVVAVPPVEFRPDRTMRLRVIGHPDQLQAAIEDLPDDIGVRVTEVSEHGVGGVGRLTDRQREALAAARDVGYFEVPREGSLADVADRLGVAASTASAHLRKAQRALVDGALDEEERGSRSTRRSVRQR